MGKLMEAIGLILTLLFILTMCSPQETGGKLGTAIHAFREAVTAGAPDEH